MLKTLQGLCNSVRKGDGSFRQEMVKNVGGAQEDSGMLNMTLFLSQILLYRYVYSENFLLRY